MKKFNEECWIIYGYKMYNLFIGITIYESIGNPGSVDFNWQKIIKRRKHIIGYNHTHPKNFSFPSDTDIHTMVGWVKALGKPLLCGIKSDKHKFFLFKRNLNQKVTYTKIDFLKLGNVIIIRNNNGFTHS